MSSASNKNKKYRLKLTYQINSKDEKLIIEKESFIVKNDKGIIKNIRKQTDINPEKEEILFEISNKKNIIKLQNVINEKNTCDPNDLDILDKRIWYIINSENNEYYLYQNDIIKFGNMKFAVNEINLIEDDGDDEEIKKKKENDINNNDNKYKDLNENSNLILDIVPFFENSKRCRFCDSYNVNLCKCKEFKHLKCLQKNIKSKTKINETEIIKSYIIDDFYCNKCNINYPFKLKPTKDTTLNLIDINYPEFENYIVLESLGYKNKENENKKIIYLLVLNDKIIKIGKNKDNNIVIDDGSISDKQAIIKFDKKNKKIILENKSEKFNTFVLGRNPLKMNESKIQFLAGKIPFEAELEKIINE